MRLKEEGSQQVEHTQHEVQSQKVILSDYFTVEE